MYYVQYYYEFFLVRVKIYNGSFYSLFTVCRNCLLPEKWHFVKMMEREWRGKCCKTRFLVQEEHSGDSVLSRRNTYVCWWHGPLDQWSIGRKLWQNIKIITSQGLFKILILLVEHMLGLFGSTLSWPWGGQALHISRGILNSQCLLVLSLCYTLVTPSHPVCWHGCALLSTWNFSVVRWIQILSSACSQQSWLHLTAPKILQ